MPWSGDTKWKIGRATTGPDDDPADAMNSQQHHALGGSRLRECIRC